MGSQQINEEHDNQDDDEGFELANEDSDEGAAREGEFFFENPHFSKSTKQNLKV